MMTEIDDAFWSIDKQRIRKEYEAQITSLQAQLNKLVDGGLEVNQDASFTFSAIDEQYKLMLEMVDDKIALKESEISKLETIVSAQQRAASNSLVARNRQIDSAFISEKTRLESVGEKVENEFDSTREEIDAIKDENFELKQKIRHLDTDIEQMYLSNQIYRMASHIDGTKELDEIKPTTVTLVAVVWFGSLAFICAIIGPILVLASLHLKSRAEKMEQEQGEPSFQAS
ncbi:mlr8221 protein [Vibrio ishigakensis]|uniref:Mlr8221 protein n=2 Tax=Vibrio ishigakensis TaxID=1481914 RepID=A0A0B8NPU8_9VIBR|nr:mlr8221 protein [Vibrio ishigakensis]